MFRVSSFAVFASGSAPLAMLACMSAGGCESTGVSAVRTNADAGFVRRDAARVDPTEAGPSLDAGAAPLPSCAKYCDLVMENCSGPNAQYASTSECLAFCAHLPMTQNRRGADEKASASVACRHYWADGPSRTSPESYCLAAGPFGGNRCGDRCTAFCTVLLSTCSPDGGVTAYPTQPDCATACAGFSFLDDAIDGGGESPYGPDNGDTLNCRLYWLRAATQNPAQCASLGPSNDVCETP